MHSRSKIRWQAVYDGHTVRFERVLPPPGIPFYDIKPRTKFAAVAALVADEVQKEIVAQSEKVARKLGLSTKLFMSSTASFLAILLVSVPMMLAFEAHVVNVTATIIQIDPPVVAPPALSCKDPSQITIDDNDPDATHIYYTITPGTDPNVAPDPVCGGALGGPKPITPFSINDDSVIKAVACDGPTGTAHHSQVVTQIYDLSCFGKIEGHKYNDLDKNEALSPGDIPIEGWRVDLKVNNNVVQTTLTDNTGYYTFNNLPPAEYVVAEEDRPNWIHVSPGVATTTITSTETKTVDFLNFDNALQCLPQDFIFPLSLAVQAGGAISGNDNIAVDSNVTVNGTVRSNNSLHRIGSAAVTRTITGKAAVKNVVDTGFLINGGTIGGAPVASIPPVDQTTWKARAQMGGTVNGGFFFPNNMPGIELGPTEIMGNLTFGSNDTVLIKGPLYIHGNLTIGNGTTITEAPAFGDTMVTIVVDGTITINPGANFVKSGTKGAFILLSNSAVVPGAGAAVFVAADASAVGDAVLMATAGDVYVGAGRTILAAFGTHGDGPDGDPNAAVRIDAGASVAYRDLPTQIACGPIQPFQTTSHVVINEFMPNPAAGKVGTPGGALDGEWVELFNPTNGPINVAGYFLYDVTNTNKLPITSANTDTGSTLIPAHGHLVVYRDGNADFSLEVTGGDTVRLLTGDIGLGGTLVDSHTYTADAPVNKSFARITDGSSNWIDPDATPGEANSFFFEPNENLPDWLPITTIPSLPPIFIDGNTTELIPVATPPDNTEIPKPYDTGSVGTPDTAAASGSGNIDATSTTLDGSDLTSTTTPPVSTDATTTTTSSSDMQTPPLDATQSINPPAKTEDPQLAAPLDPPADSGAGPTPPDPTPAPTDTPATQ